MFDLTMNFRLIGWVSLVLMVSGSVATEKQIKNPSVLKEKSYNPKEPLILTPFIKSGNLTYARNQAKVSHPDLKEIESYSGFFTVNETCGSNIFFWYFSAENDPENAPVVLYLNGGPGGSSLLCALTENGPIHMLENGEVAKVNYSWSQNYNLMYIDNPVDVGFSFTGRKDCLPTDETRVGNDLYEALAQFFQLFPDLQKNDFYVSGVSYAGKYVPATAYAIHKKNPTSEVKINLKGIAIGNGVIDGLNQHQFSSHLYQIGLIDEDGKRQFEDAESHITEAIKIEDWETAMNTLMSTLWMNNGSSLYSTLTGLKSYYNYVYGDGNATKIGLLILKYFNRGDIKQALHTGNIEFKAISYDAQNALLLDIPKSVAPMLKELLNNGYKVLLYNGQLDIIVAYSLTRNFVNQLEFNGKSEFKAAERFIWEVDQDVAGYVREGGNLSLALVRNSGHEVPKDQPKWMLDLLLGFTKPECLVFEGNRRKLRVTC